MAQGPAAKRIRLILLDDQVLFRESLGSLLALETDFDVVGQFANEEQAVDALANGKVDVIVASSSAARALIPMIRSTGALAKVLVIANRAGVDDAMRALRWGACGVIAQNTPPDSLATAVRALACGSVWFEQRAILPLADACLEFGRSSGLGFTEREQQVLKGICEGLTNRMIASNSGLTEGTVKATVRHLLRRSGVKTRSQLVGMILNRGGQP